MNEESQSTDQADERPSPNAYMRLADEIQSIVANTDREVASKITALVIALIYVLMVVVAARAIVAAIPVGVALLVPLGLIWFPEEVGGFTGYVSRGGTIDAETPPALVSFLGWLILVGVPAFAFFSWLAE